MNMNKYFYNISLFILIISCSSSNDADIVEEETPIVKETVYSANGDINNKPLFENTLRPEVFMGMPNIQDLALPERLEDWTYVRENLNGLWLNGAGTGQARVVTIAQSVSTRKYIFVAPLAQRDPTFKLSGGYYNFYNGILDVGLIFENPQLAVVNDYITKEGNNPQRYYMEGDLASTTTFLENNNPSSLGNPFGQNFYLTTRHGSFLKKIFNNKKVSSNVLVGQSYQTMLKSKGIVYERDAKELSINKSYQNSYIQAFNLAHEHDKDFVWLCPRGNNGTVEELIQGLKDSYAWMLTNKVFPDKFVLANYTREENTLPMFPMLDPDNPNITQGTFTGMLYWAIKEYEKNLVN
jgi:hypothetical protein